MKDGSPEGGKWSFDQENRKPWKGEPKAPPLPTFPENDIKLEVKEFVEKHFATHPGHISVKDLPTTLQDAKKFWTWAQKKCLFHFGPYEDAMSKESRTLFHTCISSLVNIHRLLPKQVMQDALRMDIPLSKQRRFCSASLRLARVHETCSRIYKRLSNRIKNKQTKPGYSKLFPGEKQTTCCILGQAIRHEMSRPSRSRCLEPWL